MGGQEERVERNEMQIGLMGRDRKRERGKAERYRERKKKRKKRE